MKKSWHPLLMVNQEKVWKREKEAMEEHKKLQELKRERDQERELQELRRMQEEAGGKKRQDRVDWLYAAPAAGSEANPDDLEDYLLGKKKIDKIFRGDEAQELSAIGGGKVGSTGTASNTPNGYQALQNANTVQDMAAKVREDPMLAIKKQEQAAYEALLRDPARLRQLRRQHGLEDTDKDKKHERERPRSERHRRKHESREDRHHSGSRRSHRSHRPHRHHHTEGDVSPRRSRSTSPASRYRGELSPETHDASRDYTRDAKRSHRDGYDYSSCRRSGGYDEPRQERKRDTGDHEERRSSYRGGDLRRSTYAERSQQDRRPHRETNSHRRKDRYDMNGVTARHPRNGLSGEEKAAKLAAMADAAQQMQNDRVQSLTEHEAEEAAELARDAAARESAKKRYGPHASGETVRSEFLLGQQSKMTMDSSLDLAQRLSRNRRGLERLEAE